MTDLTRSRRWKILSLLATAFFMTILDSTIVLTALPSIGRDLELDGAALQWTVTGYVLAFSGLLLFGGRAADLLGRRRMFIAGNALWVASSLLAGLAWAGGVLIAVRALQGVAAAIIAPAALSLVMAAFEEGPDRNRALGVWGGLGGVGATAGLLLGGAITAALSWSWIFFVNVPVGIAVLAISPALLPESRAGRRPRGFDAAGAGTVTAALTLLVYVIVMVPETGWASGETIAMLLAVAVLTALFIQIERRSVAPLVPFQLLRSPVLVGGNLLILTSGMVVDGLLITLTSYTQGVLGWTAMQFGLLATVFTATSIGGVMAGQSAVSRYGVRPVAVTGTALLAIAGLLTAVSIDAGSLSLLLIAQVAFGAGLGAAFVAAQIAALSDVAEHDSGFAAGLVDTSFNIGTALGVAICTSIAVAATPAARGISGLTDGYRASAATATVFAIAGLATVIALLGRRRTAPPGRTRAAAGREPATRPAAETMPTARP